MGTIGKEKRVDLVSAARPASLASPGTESRVPAPQPKQTTRQATTSPPAVIESAERRTTVALTPTAAHPIAPDLPRRPSYLPTMGEAEETRMIERAKYLLSLSDIVSARMVLEYAASAGSVKSAVALARTYDPKYLAKMPVWGVKPDIAKAIAWYQKAADQGHEEAAQRIAELRGGQS